MPFRERNDPANFSVRLRQAWGEAIPVDASSIGEPLSDDDKDSSVILLNSFYVTHGLLELILKPIIDDLHTLFSLVSGLTSVADAV